MLRIDYVSSPGSLSGINSACLELHGSACKMADSKEGGPFCLSFEARPSPVEWEILHDE